MSTLSLTAMYETVLNFYNKLPPKGRKILLISTIFATTLIARGAEFFSLSIHPQRYNARQKTKIHQPASSNYKENAVNSHRVPSDCP